MRLFTILTFIFFLLKNSFCFGGGEGDKSVGFIQPGFLIGKALPTNSNFPVTRFQNTYSLSIGKMIHDPDKLWSVYLNYPSTGLSVSYTTYGNDHVFGNSVSIFPYFSLNTSRRHFNSVHFKIGIGATYFSRRYDKYSNPRNLAIGSKLTWVFQATAYYNMLINKYLDFNIGISYIHHSNGHMKLPNLGLNSILISLSSRVYMKPVTDDYKEKYQKPELRHTKQYFVMIRAGIGLQEFGGPDSETGGVTRAVDIVSVGAGTVFKQVVKIRMGLTYRFYRQYYNYILEFQPDEFKENPVYNASNLQVYIGGELLLGHIGIDGEIGLNVFKPFYSFHQELYGDDHGVKRWLKRRFSTRLGLRFYLANTANNPKNNLFVGAYINANLSQADFSELSFGFVHRFNMRGE